MIERDDQVGGAAGAGGDEPEPLSQQAVEPTGPQQVPAPVEASTPPAPTAPPASLRVDYNQRVLCVGPTGSAKSTLINHLFTAFPVQRLLIDTKDEFAIDGVTPARSVDALDWSQPVLHYIDTEDSRDEFGRLFRVCNDRPDLIVAVHELADLCNDQPNATPPSVRRYLRKGRSHGRGFLGASQRPVSIPSSAKTEAEHVFIFCRFQLAPDDRREMARTTGLSEEQLETAVDDVRARLGEFAFLWWNKLTRELVECPPLPADVREASVVRKTTSH